MTTAEEQSNTLMRSLQREQCYLVMMRNTDAPRPDAESWAKLRLVHHDYLVDLERRGVLVGAGPCRDENNDFHDPEIGMLILRAATRAEAERIAAEEPFTAAGLRSAVLIPWQRNEGDTTLTLRLSDGILEMDRRRWKLSPVD